MKKLFPLILLTLLLVLTGCTQQMMRAQVRESRVVVLDIGHYYHPERGGQGARTPDKRYGKIEECEFWYRYVGLWVVRLLQVCMLVVCAVLYLPLYSTTSLRCPTHYLKRTLL